MSAQAPPPDSRQRVVSRGRIVHQNTHNYTPQSVGQQNRGASKKWQAEMNGHAVSSQLVSQGYSPDILLSKNSRATAQLAPLNHLAVGQGLTGGGHDSGVGKHLPDMPSIE